MAVANDTGYFLAFTASTLCRKGRMTAYQKRQLQAHTLKAGRREPYVRAGRPPLVHVGMAYVGCGDHSLYARDATSGEQLWSFKAESMICYPAIYDGKLFFGSGQHFYALERGELASILLANGNDAV